MGFFRSISEVAERLGAGTADFTDRVADEIRKFSCELWNAYPDRFTGSLNPGVSFARGFMGSVCDKNPPPPPVSSACEDGIGMMGTFYSKNISGGNCNVTGYWSLQSLIPVSKYAGATPMSVDGDWWMPTTDGRVGIRPVNETLYNDDAYPGGSSRIRFYDRDAPCQNVTGRSYGDDLITIKKKIFRSTDPVCIEANKYPPTDPPPEPPSKTVYIEENNSITEVNIQLDTGANNEFSFPLNFSINGGPAVQFNFGGFTFSGFGGGDEETPSGGGDTGGGKKVFVPEDYNGTEKPFVTGEEPQEEEDSSILFVQVDVVTPPDSGRTFVNASADDVQYVNAGYFNWTVTTDNGTFKLPDQRITRVRNIFQSPDYATGYRTYPVSGAKIKVTEFRQKE